MNKRHIGTRMEEIAAAWLEKQGNRILEHSYRGAGAEIDLIYEEGQTLVFAEVKYRSSVRYGRPAEVVDDRKRRRIVQAASLYAQRQGRLSDAIRFDVIEMVQIEGQLYIRQLKAAFIPE